MATALWMATLHQVMNGTLTKPPPAPTSPERKPITDTCAQQTGRAGQGARGLRLFVEQHLGGREGHKGGEQQGQPFAFEQGEHTQAGQRCAEHDARRQQLDDVPAHRAALVVGTHTGQRGEDDGGHGGGDGHLDREVGRHAPPTQDDGEKGHHDHAPANAQQAGQKTGAQAESGQLDDQQRFKRSWRGE